MATERSPQARKGQPQVGGPNQLPQGGASQVNRAMAAVPQQPSPDPVLQAAANQRPSEPGSLTNFDDILFSPSDYPDEPITEGAPFGPGTNFVRRGPENDDEFMKRAALTIANSKNATSRVRSFATRVAMGE